MAAAVDEWRAGLVARLGGLGLRVTDDPRALNTPCVLVGVPTTVTAGANRCTLDVVAPVYVVAPAPASAANMAYLTANVAAVLWAVGGRVARATDLTVADGQAPLPAYEIEVSATIPDDERPTP